MTRGQLLRVDAALLAAAALLLWRPWLPAWAKPEYYGSYSAHALPSLAVGADRRVRPSSWGERRASRAAQSPWLAADMRRLSTNRPAWLRIEGRPALVVGDSLPDAWPLNADKVIVQGSSIAEITEAVQRFGPDAAYPEIILWAGTAHFHFGHGSDAYVAGMPALIAELEARLAPGGRLTILSPFFPQTGRSGAADAFARLRRGTPRGCPWRFIDLQRDFAPVVSRDMLQDAGHLNAAGFGALDAWLDAQAGQNAGA